MSKIEQKLRTLLKLLRNTKKKLEKLKENPFCGKLLSGKLKNWYKLYVAKKKIRIVYRIENEILVVEVISIGRRDKKEVYKTTEKRIQ